jgi:hypothetical protein
VDSREVFHTGLRAAHAKRRRDERLKNDPKEELDAFLARKKKEIERSILLSAIEDWT